LGRIKAPGYFSDPIIRQAYLDSEWYGPAPGQIDPAKEVDAAQQRVDGGFSTLQRETMELTGEDWESNIPQIRKEQRMMKEIGMRLAAPTAPGSAVLPKEPPQNPEKPEES